jgi:hypothetical protein
MAKRNVRRMQILQKPYPERISAKLNKNTVGGESSGG